MSIPEQVRKQSAEVQQLYKDMNPEGGEQVKPEITPAAEEVPNDNTAGAIDSALEPATEPVSTERVDDGSNSEETYEKRYKTLQGMYNADVPRLQAANKEFGQRIEQLEGLIATLSSEPTAPAAVSEPEKLISEADIEEYGDSIDIMRKAAREEATGTNARIASLEQTIKDLTANVVPRVEQISSQQTQSAEQAFWSGLVNIVPDWQDINENQDFQSWLLEADPLAGATRQVLLEDAQRNMDAHRVATFFTTWKGITGVPEASQPARKASETELEQQIAPGRGRTAATPTGTEVKTYTPMDIKKFFDNVQRGKYKGKEKERDRIERDIFAAQQEGRIVTA